MSNAAISLQGVGVDYGTRAALGAVTFDVPRGVVFGLLGPNGCGKTTLFRVLSTLLRPTRGTALVAGLDVAADPAAVRRQIGVVFQSPSLDKMLTVEENLRYHGPLFGLGGDVLKARIRVLLDRLQLSDRAGARVGTLSGGMKRRVELAKGLLHEPTILLLDEPTTGLDPGARHDVWNWLADLRTNHGVTALVTTHLMEEAERCDSLAILRAGELVASGTPADLRAAMGGDVIILEAKDAAQLATDVTARFKLPATVVGTFVQVECVDGHRMIPGIVDAFPGAIISVRMGKPTLEDVFLKRTGHRFFEESATPEPEVGRHGRRKRA